jgi:hypothetical protein
VPETRVPTKYTLKKYGITEEDWRAILDRQGGGCGVCGLVPESGTLHIEHEHVRGWKKMPPEYRKRFVRGLCCFTCNTRWVGRGATPQKLRAAAKYLEEYDRRKYETITDAPNQGTEQTVSKRKAKPSGLGKTQGRKVKGTPLL